VPSSTLTHLHLFADQITDDGVDILLNNCSTFLSLSLRDSKLTNVSAINISNKCKNLTALDLSSTLITEEGLVAIANNLTSLKSFTNYNCEITENAALAIAKLPALEILRLGNKSKKFEWTPMCSYHLTNAKKLLVLVLKNANLYNDGINNN
jgi:hypothetical protein